MVKAYIANDVGESFTEIHYNLEKLGPSDVEIDVHSCGICHSDLSMWKNEWGISVFPFVGGHEITGVIANIGANVTNHKVGDRVGLGWHNGYCKNCNQCLSGDHNLCKEQSTTIIGNYGGFSEKVIAQDISVVKLPEQLDLKDAGPLLCGGVTVFNPLIQFGVKPTDKVAVIGIGGLGHLAVQFYKAWGCEVTAFTSENKFVEAENFGAHYVFNSRKEKSYEHNIGKFDFVISTVNASLNWQLIISTLAPKARLHFVGVVPEPIVTGVFPLIAGQISLSGSPVGSPATITTMLDFAARHNIKPVTEHFKMSEINQAFAHLESGEARYRIVLNKD